MSYDLNKLTKMQFGFEKEPNNRPVISRVFENYINQLYDINSPIINHSIEGFDYHTDLHRLHSNVRQYIPDGYSSNPHDNLIYDILKKGKPSGEHIARIFDVIHSNDGVDVQNKVYLDHKWMRLIQEHCSEYTPKINKQRDAIYTKSELNSIPSSFTVGPMRTLTHKATNHIFEYHPTEGLRYLGSSINGRMSANSFDLSLNSNRHLNQSVKLSNLYSAFPSPHIVQYTAESAAINRYLHTKEKYPHQETSLGKPVDMVVDTANGITDHLKTIQHPTHTPDFTVYTGIHAENNPNTDHTLTEDGYKLYHSPAFISTTLTPNVAEQFARMKTDPGHDKSVRDVVKMKIPGGYPHGMYVESMSEHSSEHEYLLDKDHVIKIHPEPVHYTRHGAIYRLWQGELVHKSVRDTDFKNLTTNEKITKLLNPDCDEVSIGHGASDDNISVRAAAAKHHKLSLHHMEELKDDLSPKVKHALMLNPSLPHHILEHAFKSDSPSSINGITERSHVPSEFRDKIMNSTWTNAKIEFAKRKDLTDSEVETLSNMQDDAINSSLGSNHYLSQSQLHTLSKKNNLTLTRAVAANSSISHRTARDLALHPDRITRDAAYHNVAINKIEGQE